MLCPFVLYFGKKRYTLYPPTGSVLSKSFRILMYCAKGIWFSRSALSAPDFWEKAKPSNVSAEEQARLPWMTYDDAFVDEVARGFQACRVVSTTWVRSWDRY
jgi:POT family proton-dependent oligopeptide transporter